MIIAYVASSHLPSFFAEFRHADMKNKTLLRAKKTAFIVVHMMERTYNVNVP